MNDLGAFAQLVRAVAPWRGQLVFIGGWGHRLHTLHPSAGNVDFAPVFTRDTDLAFADKRPLQGDIKSALLDQGFHEELSGDFKPPTAHYTLGNDQGGFYAEFLTPLVGSGYKRNGEKDATVKTAGISAQKIRHLDILMVDPWAITVSKANGFPLENPVDVQVANPLCFMVQKLLIKQDRPPRKQAQDLLYIHDTIQLFGHRLPAFKKSWEDTVGPALAAASKTVLRECMESFSQVTDTVRQAAAIPQDRKISAEEFQATCRYAFSEILGMG
ncbi:GSU2403 family nucleotidyltransferase fold protein [Hydrogenophaga sp. BPS33]|uniref:GSU2403 family nucleotidyltransferase fold protein n=1 Tax=Hydrogenophaga sp. BPS33 TaxID=2651974 RepID=UPI0013202C15|nr:GSU2403 family nucleotidyltransferase fold protein [Hydrogenophaga sp. BPS33]QHE88161.1 hypothetical protein F9K07_26315 [Hydrogenophaga sp. BPS33]